MGRSKKRGGSSGGGARPPAERVAELRGRLDELGPADVSDAELDALIAGAAREEPEVALTLMGRLGELTGGSKVRQKALRRGLHRLRQRGIDVSGLELDERPEGIRIAPEPGEGGGLPVLLAPPDINAQRQMTFGLARGPGVVVVDCLFKARELFRLMARPSNRPTYRRWARQLCEAPAEGALPERVELSAAWLTRKLWEIAEHNRRGDLGREVDKGLLDFLEAPAAEPPHPALELGSEGGSRLSLEQLATRPERLHAFYHGAALGALRAQWYERGGEKGITPGEAGALALREEMRVPVTDWAEEWGLDRVVELLLDAALYFDGVGDADAARTFVDLARVAPGETSRGRDGRIRDFLLDLTLWQLAR